MMIKFGGWESEVASFGCKFWWHQSIECQHVTSKAKSHSDDDVADANLLTSENQLKEGGHNTDDLSAQWIWNDIFCTSHDRVPNILVPLFFITNFSSAAAFAPNAQPSAQTALSAEADRRAFLGAAAAFGAAAIPAAANAVVDYENIAQLGGGNVVDLNNANIRSYLRMKGMYPGAAGKIVSHGPYKTVSDVYNIPGLTAAEKDVIKRYESAGRFSANQPAPEYVIDRINNGLYR